MRINIQLPYDTAMNYTGKVKVVDFNPAYPNEYISFQGSGMGGDRHPLPQRFRWDTTKNESRWAYYAPFMEMREWLARVEAWARQEIIPEMKAICSASVKISMQGFQPEIKFPQELAIENDLIRQLPRIEEGNNRFKNVAFSSEDKFLGSGST